LLKQYATSQKVVGSIPDEAIGFFHLQQSSRIMALKSTQTITEMSITIIPGGVKRGQRLSLAHS
jgi:hypothetical protein